MQLQGDDMRRGRIYPWTRIPRSVERSSDAKSVTASRPILQARKRAARLGRNPATGEQIRIKASKKAVFRASKDLKETI
jgi:DNA-binding protein HU-beta